MGGNEKKKTRGRNSRQGVVSGKGTKGSKRKNLQGGGGVAMAKKKKKK